jgi:hypothetical protein
MDKKSGSGMSNPDHISESLEKFFCVKILKFLDAVPGSGMRKNSDPGWKKFGSRINTPDPQHCFFGGGGVFEDFRM